MACALFELLKLFYEDFDEFCKKIEKFKELGVLSEVYINKEKGIVWARGQTGTGAGLVRNMDPITAFVQLNLMFYGMYFAYLPDAEIAFKKVKEWWKEKFKKEKISKHTGR